MNPCFDEAMERKRMYQERAKELNMLIKLPFKDKLKLTLKTIKRALNGHKKPVIASSFGKDSIALIHLVHGIDETVPVVFTQTGVQFKETLQYKDMIEAKWGLTLFVLKPKRTFWQIVKEHNYPRESRNSKTGDKREPRCCKELKHKPMKEFIREYKPDIIFTGLLAGEGRQRRMAYIYNGDPIYTAIAEGVDKCIPLIWWTTKEVWHYHDLENIPRNPVYSKYNIERTGCIPCTGHKNWREQLARTHPKMYRKISHDLGQNLIEDYILKDVGVDD